MLLHYSRAIQSGFFWALGLEWCRCTIPIKMWIIFSEIKNFKTIANTLLHRVPGLPWVDWVRVSIARNSKKCVQKPHGIKELRLLYPRPPHLLDGVYCLAGIGRASKQLCTARIDRQPWWVQSSHIVKPCNSGSQTDRSFCCWASTCGLQRRTSTDSSESIIGQEH